jgi:TP901 family phage tail tape measure protein
MAITVASLVAKVKADTSDAEKNIGGFAGKLVGFGGIVAATGIAIGAAAIGIGIASVKMAGDFQAGMTTLVTGAGESQKNLKMVSDGILGLAVSTGTSTQQLTAGMFQIESAGYHGAAGLDVLKVAAQGAKVGNADLGVTANAVTTIMKDYGISADHSAQAMNVLTGIVSNGKTTLQDLAGSMSSILPTSSALGVSLNDTAGAMATMTGEGVPAANAATYLRQMLLALSAPASAGAKALKDIGLTTGQVSADMKKSLPDTLKMIMTHLAETYKVGSPEYVAALKAIAGGSKQMQGMLDLTGDHLGDFAQNVKNVAGVVQQGGNSVTGWSLVQQNFNFKMSQAKEVVETFMIKLGTGLLPIAGKLVGLFATNFIPAVSSLADWFGTHLAPAIVGTGGFLEGTLLPAATKFAGFVGSTVIPIVQTLVSVFVSDILPAVENVSTAFLKHLLPPVEDIASKILPVLNPLLQVLGFIFGHVIFPAIGLVITVIGGLLSIIDGAISKVGQFIGILQAVAGFIGGGLNAAFRSITGVVSSVFGGLYGLIRGPIDAIINGINWLIGGLDNIHFDVPGWVPGVGGKGFGISIPKIPLLAGGGTITQPGYVVVGDAGPELLKLPAGAQVAPLQQPTLNASPVQSQFAAAQAQAQQWMHLILQLDTRTIAEKVMPYVTGTARIRAGLRGA